MACNISHSQRTKCSGLRGPQHGFWIWCLFQCLISLPCVFSSCLGVNLSLSLIPDGVVSVKYGHPLRLLCIADNSDKTKNYTSKDLVFTHKGIPVNTSRVVNETSIELYVEQPHKQLTPYHCTNTKSKKLCVSRVLVDSEPMKVTDFKCISKNLDILNCSWTVPHSFATINYALSFLVNDVQVPACTPVEPDLINRYCTWNVFTSEPRYRQQEEEYFFMLKAWNQFGVTYQNFTIDHFAIVKPGPPEALTYERVSPHSVLLKWQLPAAIKNFLTCGVEHRIEYQIGKIDNKSYFHSVDTSHLPLLDEKGYTFLLKDLPYAHMQYEVRVYIKSKKATDELWSDKTFRIFSTLGEIPKRPPELVAGAFSEGQKHGKKVITIYWRQLEEYEEAGANFTYKVNVTQGSKTQTLYPDKNKSLSYVQLQVPWEAMEITVWSKNDNGTSENSSHLYIPAKANDDLKMETFTQLSFEEGQYKLSWVGKPNISNYTLFWCHYNITYMCPGRMNFTVLNGTENSYEIFLPKDHRYQFAISANSGARTSGMVWAQCAISKDSIPMYGFPLTFTNDAPGRSFVKFSWAMKCTLQDGTIIGYVLKYCVVINTTNICDPAYEKKSEIISNADQKEVNVTGLLPHKTYLFSLDLNTTYGVKVNASRSITTTEDTPTAPQNITIEKVDSNSLVISWDPPSPRNGIIGHYAIYDHEKDILDKVPVEEDSKDIKRRTRVLNNLTSFKNYSITVQACNTGIHSCSGHSPIGGIFVRTKIGAPSKLSVPIVNNSYIQWAPPDLPGGTVDLYQIRKVKDDTTEEIYNSTNLSFELKLCEGVVERETYELRAINLDTDPNGGAIGDSNVNIQRRKRENVEIEHLGEWSDPAIVNCRSQGGFTMTLIFMTVFALLGVGYGTLKLYKRYRKMGDIKPVLPDGLSIPEKEPTKYGLWTPANKDEKPSSDEMLLLPNSKGVVTSPEVKQKDNSNCGSSDHTDSTALSDTSRGAVERQTSTSDNSSNSSLNLEVETVKADDNNLNHDGYSLDNSDLESLQENSSYFIENFNKDPPPVVNPNTGYVEAVPTNHVLPQKSNNLQPAGSSYVLAGLSPPIFTTGMMPPSVNYQPPTSSGYVRHDDAQIKSMMNLPNLGLSPSKALGPESLPTMPSLPQSAKCDADSSYIQLQSLDVTPSLKPAVRNTVPLKPQVTSGYVSTDDPMLHKHLNMICAGRQPVEESAILDPTMSPDAYCRFSWNNDPAKDNLNTFYSSKN